MKWILPNLCLLLFIVSFNQVLAQSKAKDGDYYYKVGSYDRALRSYKRELRKKNQKSHLYSNIITCYLKSNIDRSKALPYAEKVLDKGRTVKAVLNHGMVLFYCKQFTKAMQELEWVKVHVKKDSEEYGLAHQYIAWIINAIAYTNKPLDVEFINLGKDINTNKSELNPFVTLKDDMLIYSSNKKYLSSIGINYFNVCMSLRNNNYWQKGKTIGSSINTGYDEIVAGYSPEGNSLFVFHNRDKVESVGFSDYKGNCKFKPLKSFSAPIDKKGGEFGVWVSNNKDTLVYSATNEAGNIDIYYALKLPDGEYGEPRPLPGKVNSKYDEDFPVLTHSGKRIYFSSNGEASMGGHDLFYADWDDKLKEWGEPVNIGYPINDMYDNYSISLTKGNRYAYVSAIRPEGFGERDIYKVLFKDGDVSDLILRCTTLIETDSGNVVPSYPMRIELYDSSTNEKIGVYRSSSDSARFVMALEPGSYKVSFFKAKTCFYSKALVIPEMWYVNEPVRYEFIIPNSEKP